MKFKKFLVMLMAALMLLGTTTSVFAASLDKEEYSDTAGNYFFTDDAVEVKNGTYFGMFGAGNNIELDNTVADDSLALVGRIISLKNTKANGSIFAAGYDIQIASAEVKGNIMAAGRDLTVNKDVTANAAYMAGYNVSFLGTAKAVSLAGKSVIIDGTVDGDVRIDAEEVIIGGDANITGTLKINAVKEPQLPETAKVGKVEFTSSKPVQQQLSVKEKMILKIMASIFTLISMFILGLVICLVFPRQLDTAVEIFKKSKVKMLFLGLLSVILAPIIFVILMITGVGAPLGVVGILFYVIFMIIAVPFMGASILRKRIPKIPGIIPSLLGIILFQLLTLVPYLGPVIHIFAVLYTFGFMILYVFGRKKDKEDTDDVEEAEEFEAADEEYDYAESIPESVEMKLPEVVEDTLPELEDNSEE